MRTNPFAVLEISPRATPAEARTAYRRLALRHHPDRNPGDRSAAGRFKRVLRAYRAVRSGRAHLGRAHGGEASPPPPGPRPDRFGCPSCGDTFPFAETCPRCEHVLHDRSSGPTPAASSPEVEAMIDDLLSRPERPASHWSDRVPVPGLLITGCLLAALAVWRVGPLGPSLLFAGFAAYVGFVELYRRVSHERSFES